MNIENYIESQYRELASPEKISAEFADLYLGIEHAKLREMLTILHHEFISLFKLMNERLPTNEYGNHFWADPSRDLIKTIEITLELYSALKSSKYAFQIDDYYAEIIYKCREFLKSSGGSTIPANMEKIELYYTIPIFIPSNIVVITNPQSNISASLELIGVGSYANVFKYKDAFYNKYFVLKRAKEALSTKEIERFKREFKEMQEFSSPYILEVYCYNEEKNEYIMEYMDYTLNSYIEKYKSSLSTMQRKNIVFQILRAFEYIHSKGRLHRDISPKNVLIKTYEDALVVKIADFGLVKIPDSLLTTASTDFKGYFNDPFLRLDGFDTYGILHETYALSLLIYYVMTGKTNTDNIADFRLRDFMNRGLNNDKSKRFFNVSEIAKAFKLIDSN